ncbi:MAG: cyclodeaminase/cyclohydrolase family protein [Lachnospiraceae bacterium]|nr:cyclodeaminase/cyclohydrolase family protein [Lachnospiraceae bacterium]
MITDYAIDDFLTELSSSAPVPGGGGASAVSGAMGVSLGAMSLNLTIGKKKYAEYEEELREALSELETLRDVFLSLADKDEEVFLPLQKAYGLPRKTEEERQIRESFMERALIDATEIPLQVMDYACQALRVLRRTVELVSPLSVSDTGVGASFLGTAVKGAGMNVLINLKSMKDPVRTARYRERYERSLSQGEKLSRETLERTEERIGG